MASERGIARLFYPLAAMKKVFQRLQPALKKGLLALPESFPYLRDPILPLERSLIPQRLGGLHQKPVQGHPGILFYGYRQTGGGKGYSEVLQRTS